MAIKKEIRIKVYNKYRGHCAYCGNKIKYEDMQVDHKHPQHLSNWVSTAKSHKRLKDKYNIPDNIDDISNLMPSCRRCNHYKRGLLLESFRQQIKSIDKRIEKQYIVKVGIDYGIVGLSSWHGNFFFEIYDMGILDYDKLDG
jgi:5-methylcytosine-specific restriction endonuclease McrA